MTKWYLEWIGGANTPEPIKGKKWRIRGKGKWVAVEDGDSIMVLPSFRVISLTKPKRRRWPWKRRKPS